MARYSTPFDEEDAPAQRACPDCPGCAADNPQDRYTHWLHLVKVAGLTALEAHLKGSFPGTGHARHRGALMEWARGQVTQYSGMAADGDGHPMPWWEGRAVLCARTKARRPPSRETTEHETRPLAALIDRMVLACQQQASVPDHRWAQFHLALLREGLGQETRRLEMAQAYRALAGKDRELAGDCLREAVRCEQEADEEDNSDVPF